MNAKNKITELEELRDQMTILTLAKQESIDTVITPELKQQLNDIDAEFIGKFGAVAEKIAEAEAAVKELVLAEGKTSSGTFLQAVYRKGSTKWDTEKLDGYAAAHPEILQFKTEGKPSVAIQVKK